MKLTSINPYTEEINAQFETISGQEIADIAEDSKKAFGLWRHIRTEEKAFYIKKIGNELRKNKNHLAGVITSEMGKIITQSLAEIEKCAWVCDYYAENLSGFLKKEEVATEYFKTYVDFEPLGVILGIMPWNFPFWQVFRFAIPAIAAGNTVLLKHASSVPLCALEIENIFKKAGLPDNLFNTLLIDEAAAMGLIDADKVQGVSLTGSNRAGEQIGGLAGKKIIKTVLELGGSDPFIVLPGADLEKAAETGVKSRFINAGQSCIAAKRFIVLEEIAEEFSENFKASLLKLKIGNPLNEETDIGPVAQKRFADGLKLQLEESLALGGEIFFGPEINDEKGFFVRPAVVFGALPEMRIMKEEVFGPIAPVIIVKSESEAVKVANSSEFGLGASVWSADLDRAENLAKKIEAGFVVINDMVKSDPRLPFGGIKKSGVGRELSHYGLKEFTNIKTIIVNNI